MARQGAILEACTDQPEEIEPHKDTDLMSWFIKSTAKCYQLLRSERFTTVF
jgi:hypothetical protein